MPGRKSRLVTDFTYHVFNKTLEQKRIFEDEEMCQIFLNTVSYYRSSNATLRFSNFKKLSPEPKLHFEKKIDDKRSFRVSLLAYCLMPTHYHFLLRQNHKNGISVFMSQIQNSFTRYYNIRHERTGPIFLHTFKSKLIQNEGQLKHVSRYIHLNPFSNGLVIEVEQIQKYRWSSFHEYISLSNLSLSEWDSILSLFDNNRGRYKSFVLGNAEQQKMLEYCKYSKRW